MAQTIKNLPAMQETWVQSLGQEDLLEKRIQNSPVFLPGEFHGHRSLVGYSPWVAKSRTLLSEVCSEGWRRGICMGRTSAPCLGQTETELESTFFSSWPCHVACPCQFLDSGLNPGPQQWKHRILTIRPPGKSPGYFLWLHLLFPFP